MSTCTIVVTRGPDSYSLHIKDDTSGSNVCEIEMTPEQFAGAITAASQRGVSVEWGDIDKIGLRRETKEELVEGANYEARVAAIIMLEVDGWIGRHDDARNKHRRQNNRYRVSFKRFVIPDADPAT